MVEGLQTTARRLAGSRRWRGALVVLVAIGALATGALTACETTEEARREIVALLNETRAAEGLPPLQRDVVLEVKADTWAQHLRDTCDLRHSRLSSGAPEGWLKLGENVGVGNTIPELHDAFLASPDHRANILDEVYDTVGVAAVYGVCDGYTTLFVVTEFMQAPLP